MPTTTPCARQARTASVPLRSRPVLLRGQARRSDGYFADEGEARSDVPATAVAIDVARR